MTGDQEQYEGPAEAGPGPSWARPANGGGLPVHAIGGDYPAPGPHHLLAAWPPWRWADYTGGSPAPRPLSVQAGPPATVPARTWNALDLLQHDLDERQERQERQQARMPQRGGAGATSIVETLGLL